MIFTELYKTEPLSILHLVTQSAKGRDQDQGFGGLQKTCPQETVAVLLLITHKHTRDETADE